MLKKILKISAIVLAVFLALAFTLPFLFKGKILAMARQGVNKNLNATVDFSDVDLSLFRHFPRLAIGLDDISVTGKNEFSGDTLMAARQIDVAVNLFSLFGGSGINIYSISIDQPRIHAIVDKEGRANWNITAPDTTSKADSGSGFRMHLNAYRIKDGYIRYTDMPGNMDAEIEHLDHSGSGDFTADLFTLTTKTTAESVSFTYSGIPYLVRAKTSLDADISVDNKLSKYSFKTDAVHVNDLQLSTEGFFRIVNDSTYGMDISFHAPSTDFKTLLSLVPSIYQNDFNKIKTSGTAAFDGYVKGEYNSTKIPSYLINLKVDNGFFQYPDLPQPVKNIGIVMKVENPDGITDHTVVDIPKAHIEFGNDPFDFRLLFKNPITAQYIDASLKGKLNLADITHFVKLSAGTKLSGMIDANASAKGNLSVITRQKPGEFTANGTVQVSALNYSSPDFPQPIRNGNIQLALENPDGQADHTLIRIPSAHLEIGSDPVDFNIALKTPVSNPVFDGRLKGSFDLANTKQFTALPQGTRLSGKITGDISFSGNKQQVDRKEYDKINTSGTVVLTGIHYASKTYPDEFLLSSATLRFDPKNISLNNAAAEWLGTHFNADGSIVNAIGYATKDEPLAGTLNIRADQVDLNRFMKLVPADSSKPASKTAEPFQVPKNLSFGLQAKVDKMKYDKTEYTNVSGALAIHDEVVALKDVQMNALDGQITASGFYSTKKDKKNPEIAFNYSVKSLDVQKTFYAFNTVQKLMPAGQFVDGKMNSQLSLNGRLNPDLSPDLRSLTGKGNLDLIDGVFKKFAPVEKLAEQLHLSQLENLSLKDVKLSFEFANGKVLVQPFHVKYNGIDMEIGGMHGFDQSIDYVIAMKVPRSMLGGDANNLLNNLVSQANNKGVPVKLSDNINIKVNMTGTISNPKVKPLLGGGSSDVASDVKQQAAIFEKQAEDSAKKVLAAKSNEAKDSAKVIKDQAVKDIQKDLGKVVSGQKDSTGSGKVLENTQKNAEQTIKNTFNNLFNKKKTPTADSTKVKS